MDKILLSLMLSLTLAQIVKAEVAEVQPDFTHNRTPETKANPAAGVEPRVIPELITLQSSVIIARPISAEVLNKKFREGPFKGKGQLIIDMANKHGIDPLFLASYYAFETGWGRSPRLEKQKNPALIPEVDEKGATRYDGRGMPLFKTFNTIEEGIEAGAVYLKQIASNQPVKNPSTLFSITNYVIPEPFNHGAPKKITHQKSIVGLMNGLARLEANK